MQMRADLKSIIVSEAKQTSGLLLLFFMDFSAQRSRALSFSVDFFLTQKYDRREKREPEASLSKSTGTERGA
jgi:hypothetical protein